MKSIIIIISVYGTQHTSQIHTVMIEWDELHDLLTIFISEYCARADSCIQAKWAPFTAPRLY